MGLGRFGDDGELFFEIQLVAANGEVFSIEALFDTGFTDGIFLYRAKAQSRQEKLSNNDFCKRLHELHSQGAMKISFPYSPLTTPYFHRRSNKPKGMLTLEMVAQ